jgi:hypothetical protein
MGDWQVEIEFTGRLTPAQLERAAEGAFMAHYNETTNVLRLRQGLNASTFSDAVFEARGWVESLPAFAEFVAAGVLAGPDRFNVETATARARMYGADLLGAAETAARLGVSTSRLRHLEQRPDFPRPALTLAGGRIYRAEDIDAFNRGWNRRPGRPPRQ